MVDIETWLQFSIVKIVSDLQFSASLLPYDDEIGALQSLWAFEKRSKNFFFKVESFMKIVVFFGIRIRYVTEFPFGSLNILLNFK